MPQVPKTAKAAATAQNALCISSLGTFISGCGRNIDVNNAASVGPMVAKYDADFAKRRAEVVSLKYDYNNLMDARPQLGGTLDGTISELETEVAKLGDQIEEMENEKNVSDAEFHENTDPIRGRRDAATLQDWVIFLAFVSYAFAALCVIGYIGYTTNWNKKMLLIGTLGTGMIFVVLYSFLINFG